MGMNGRLDTGAVLNLIYHSLGQWLILEPIKTAEKVTIAYGTLADVLGSKDVPVSLRTSRVSFCLWSVRITSFKATTGSPMLEAFQNCQDYSRQ